MILKDDFPFTVNVEYQLYPHVVTMPPCNLSYTQQLVPSTPQPLPCSFLFPHITTSLFSISMSLFVLYHLYQFVVFFRFHI